MEAREKKVLKALSLELRHLLEGQYDSAGHWLAGDLEQRLNAIGVWRERTIPADEMHLSSDDSHARSVVDAYLKLREEAGVRVADAVAEFVRETAYTWANRLLALRCMEARELIDEVVLQKEVYGGRSLEHHRLIQRQPEVGAGEDDGLFAALDSAFTRQAEHLPLLFDPKAPGVALKPSVAAIKRSVALLSGNVQGYPADDDVFKAPDALGWAYQYWNTEEKDRVFETVRTKKGAKIEGADIVPATQLYTEDYMVKFLVQNSLGATWVGMKPDTELVMGWEYFVRDADRAPVEKKPVSKITFLDPACGSGHFLIEAFDLFFDMYKEEGEITDDADIYSSILTNNIFGIDIDQRAVEISEAALWMKAAERAFGFTGAPTNLVATNIRLPRTKDHLREFLAKHPEDKPLAPALEAVFDTLQHADELGSLLQLEEPVEKELKLIKQRQDEEASIPRNETLFDEMRRPVQTLLPINTDDWGTWKTRTVERIREHFLEHAEAANLQEQFFGAEAGKGWKLFDLLGRKYDVVAANPPYMGWRSMGPVLQHYLQSYFRGSHVDLCAAFLECSIRMLRKSGFSSFILQKTVMFNSTLAGLRSVVLRDTHIRVVAHLGTRAFSELTGAKVDPAMICLMKTPESERRNSSVFMRISGGSADEKIDSLKRIMAGMAPGKYCVSQDMFYSIDSHPFAYRLNLTEQGLISAGRNGRDQYKVCAGISTANNTRFVRYFWEVCQSEMQRWWPCNEGGVAHRWLTDVPLRIEWQWNAARLRAYEGSALRNMDKVALTALTFSRMSGCDLGVRFLPSGYVSLDTGRTVHLVNTANTTLHITMALLNSRYARRMLRVMNDAFGATSEDLERLPLPELTHYVGVDLVARVLEHVVLTTYRTRMASQHYDPRSLATLRTTDLQSYARSIIRECINADAVRVAASDESNRLIEKDLGYGGSSNELNQDGWQLAPPSPSLSARWDSVLASARTGLALSDTRTQPLTVLPIRMVENACTEWLGGVVLAEPSQLADNIDDENANDSMDEADVEYGNHPEGVIGKWSSSQAIDPMTLAAACIDWFEGKAQSPELRMWIADLASECTIRLLGHRWPKQIEAGEPVPDWADLDGAIPLTDNTSEPSLFARVRDRLAAEFGNGNVEREFEEIMGRTLSQWLVADFFGAHISQFKKRPIAWQLQIGRFNGRKSPAFACMAYYHKLSESFLPTMQSQYIRPLRQRFETELRGIENTPAASRTGDQTARRVELTALIDELNDFDSCLDRVTNSGFATAMLRQYAIDDAMLALKARWLKRLSESVASGPLPGWQGEAVKTALHEELGKWIGDALTRLDYSCAKVGPVAPQEKSLVDDPVSADFAKLIAPKAKSMVSDSLKLACDVWWKMFDDVVLGPIKEQIKVLNEEHKTFDAEHKMLTGKTEPAPDKAAEFEQLSPTERADRVRELERRMKQIKLEIKPLRDEQNEKTDKAKKLRTVIEKWTCPEAETWEPWLASQPLYDQVSALDGVRQPPTTVADFIRQESLYAPDINDGVRVNIAPIQKIGLLAADVLATKDLDKAIADRAEWRSDERRWVREGKLPQPGWWG